MGRVENPVVGFDGTAPTPPHGIPPLSASLDRAGERFLLDPAIQGTHHQNSAAERLGSGLGRGVGTQHRCAEPDLLDRLAQ